VRRFTVGFVLTDPPAPSVLGSGVLVSVGPTKGIFTCAHVAERFRQRPVIGLLRFSHNEQLQMQKLQLGDTTTLNIAENIGDPPWSNPEAFDLAFVALPPRDVATLEATCVFLNWDMNRDKFMSGEPERDANVDGVFGLVNEFSGEPVKDEGLVTTPMKGVLTPGHVVARDKGLMTLECMDYNISELPKCFGGNSGGGLWRLYLNMTDGGGYELVQARLCGIASFQLDQAHILCQGFDRIDQALIPEIRKAFGN
jgi:hypothetical protein